MAKVDLGPAGNISRDELLQRITHYETSVAVIDRHLEKAQQEFPQVEALLDIRGVGLYTALLIVAEIGGPERFREGRQVAAYAGLTQRVLQSGDTCYHGRITRQGSPWLRWILVQVALHAKTQDKRLENFYQRIRKRSSAKIARVALARKLAVICWVRLSQWETEHQSAA
jgi:transposase